MEHTERPIPLWLATDRCVILKAITKKRLRDGASARVSRTDSADLRLEHRFGRKIRDNELKRIPYLLIVGEKRGTK